MSRLERHLRRLLREIRERLAAEQEAFRQMELPREQSRRWCAVYLQLVHLDDVLRQTLILFDMPSVITEDVRRTLAEVRFWLRINRGPIDPYLNEVLFAAGDAHIPRLNSVLQQFADGGPPPRRAL